VATMHTVCCQSRPARVAATVAEKPVIGLIEQVSSVPPTRSARAAAPFTVISSGMVFSLSRSPSSRIWAIEGGKVNRGHSALAPRQRMVAAHHTLQPLARDMGVDFRRRDVGMSQHLLDGAQIRAVVEQMGGEGVAQHVRADLRRVEAGGERALLQQLRETLARQETLSRTA